MEYTNILDVNDPVPIHAGFLCTSNYIIRTVLRFNLKTPFMMMRISLKNISDAIKDDFASYLDKTKYIVIEGGIGHKDFPTLLWNHIDPTTDKGYTILQEQVESYRNAINQTGQRPIIFICFAGRRRIWGNEIIKEINTMVENVDQDAIELLNTAGDLYRNRDIKIFIFSDENEILEKIEKIQIQEIVPIPISHSIYTWEMTLETQTNAIQQMKDLYHQHTNTDSHELKHTLPLPHEFFL